LIFPLVVPARASAEKFSRRGGNGKKEKIPQNSKRTKKALL